MKIGDSIWIVIRNYPDKVHVRPHVEREAAYDDVNDAIDVYAEGTGFKDPGRDDPEARLEAWNDHQGRYESDPYLIHVEEEPLVR